jgi:hypothetical protein
MMVFESPKHVSTCFPAEVWLFPWTNSPHDGHFKVWRSESRISFLWRVGSSSFVGPSDPKFE